MAIQFWAIKTLREAREYFRDNRLFDKVYEDDITEGYRFVDPLPRALFVTNALYIKNKKEILDIFKQPSFDPKTTVILEEPLNKFNLSGNETLATEVNIVKYLPTKADINIKTESPGFFILLDTYYPGWKAYIDDRPAHILRANYLFRAVYIDKPGIHTIKFVYSPLSLKLGAAITLITIVGCVGGMFWARKRTS